MTKKFNFQEAREKAIKAADEELEQGLKQMAEKGSTEQSDTRDVATPAAQ